MSFKIGIITALPFEAACISNKKISPGSYQAIPPNVFVYSAGMGSDNATQAAKTLIKDAGVDALVSWGVAGALDPRLRPGEIVLPEYVVDDNNQRYQVNQHWHTRLKTKLGQANVYTNGGMASSEKLQHKPQLKSALHHSTQTLAIDMESAAIAKVATQADKPFIIIRSIFDGAGMSIPQSSTEATDQHGRISISKLLAGLIRHPSDLLHYPNLVSSFAKAKAGLRRVAQITGNELCFAEVL